MTSDEFIEALLSAPDVPARQALMDESRQFLELETVQALKMRADRQERDDPRQTLTIGLVAEEVAGRLTNNNDEALALALWAQANGHNHLAELEPAARCYERAAELFNAGGKPLEAARTDIGQMGTLWKMGQFERAYELAASARAVFVEHGDLHYQAITDMNLGTSHYLQGQYLLALEDYRKATEGFQALGETSHVAMNQINQALQLQHLDIFLMAEELYEQARPVFEVAGMRTAVAFGDVDLAILQSSRGNYTQAFQTFEHARDIFTELADQGNLAQTDLEESDLYLSLNLPDDALRLAEAAEHTFSDRGFVFELAAARVNQAVALARLGQGERAASLLEQARAIFVDQGNQTWSAHTDLQRAEIVAQYGQGRLAIRLATAAAAEYEKLGMTTKQVYAHIIAANAWAAEQAWPQALDELKTARRTLGDLAAPWLEQRIDTCLGRVHEGLGERVRAIEHYQRAAGWIEQIASTLTAEEHRTAYVTDKLAPYEALVALYGTEDPALAFQWAEQAKSRALVDMLAAGVTPRLHLGDGADAQLLERLQVIRAELNWFYTRLTRGVAPGETGAPAAGPDTWHKIHEAEREATSLWRDLQGRHAEQLSLISVAPLNLADLQANLPVGTALLEYFVARDQVIAFVITRDRMCAYPAVASLTELRPLFENLAFQFSKFQYGPAYYQRHRAAFLDGTRDILAQFGQKLLAPFWQEFSSLNALIIIPHGPLHALPFQALRVADRYLIEHCAVSYAPSAAVLKFCWDKPAAPPSNAETLLVGVPDERAAHITDEIQALAALFGHPIVLLGEQAGFDQVCRSAPSAGILHLAAHGLFRPEAPLLSSIRLADRWLAVQDIYDLDLHAASLVTLSACETGLGRDAGGDDLVGLVRGFLYAGAASLIVSLWTVDDESMTQLVVGFYTHWLAGQPKARALRQAQLDLLEKYEHPFYWAPLALVGNQN
jgi:CHAT domain-containing protein/tetratricopeptide (TPR) repeat protein